MSELRKIILTAILAFCTGIVATALGSWWVHWLTQSRERDSWIRSSRIKEWQELLDSMTKAYMTFLRSSFEYRADVQMENAAKLTEVMADVDIVLSTRIFIADIVEDLNLRKKWAALIEDYRRGRNMPVPLYDAKQAFMDRFQALRRSMVEVAKQTK